MYALIGIPLNALLIGSLGNLFGSKLKRILLHFQEKNSKEQMKPRCSLLMMETGGFILLFTGFLLLVPAAIFMHFEAGMGDFFLKRMSQLRFLDQSVVHLDFSSRSK